MKRVKFEASEQRVLILPDSKKEMTPGGIIIPRTHEDNRPEFGTIIETGKGSIDHPMEYHRGERVLYSEYAGTEVELNLDDEDRKYKVMNQMDIMGKIKRVD